MAANAQNRRTLRFNGFEVDPRSREVRRNGSRVRLAPGDVKALPFSQSIAVYRERLLFDMPAASW